MSFSDVLPSSKLSALLSHSSSGSHRHRREGLLSSSPPPLLPRRASGTPFFRLRNLGHRQCLTELAMQIDISPQGNAEIERRTSRSGAVVELVDLSDELEELSTVELVTTRCLPPASSIGEAVNNLKAEVDKLEKNPPCSKSGVLRIQIAVPPDTKAFNWLYSQKKFFDGCPEFFVQREKSDNFASNFSTDALVGVSGIGASICFQGSSQPSKVLKLIGRYISIDSPLIRFYAGTVFNFKRESSRKEDNYFFIPQIELDELETYSILATTLVWDDYLSISFEDALRSMKNNLYKIIPTVLPYGKYSPDTWLNRLNGSFSSAEVIHGDLVCLSADALVRLKSGVNFWQQEDHSESYISFLRTSSFILTSTPMLSNLSGPCRSIKELSNINHVWASLIVEECVRLGLTYFCIAPGSRSSPLAISACRHPKTTCISCFDERALAFHALGYARGSQRPAVVITSSGTAVSNLLPAVVEASYGFVPILLLTADRPPELIDTGANQAISQVEHYGKNVRFFFNLPVPCDDVPARMVLSTVDSAINWATQSPRGPVHINCPFREPLDDYPSKWDLNCLKGLNSWLSAKEPFTKYEKLQAADTCHDNVYVTEVLEEIRSSTCGILIFGDIQTEDDMWAAILLAKHLSWPIFADICSGVRLRRALTSSSCIEESFIFIDHLDQVLLSPSVKSWMHPDVVVQIGTRITSKRITQFLESSSLRSYIVVDKHPYRYDPSHIVTHRIQSTVGEFSDVLRHTDFERRKTSNWSSTLKALNTMVSHEIAFQISSESSLTEPHVSRIVSENLPDGSALFIGNSMVIRDMDTLGSGWVRELSHDSLLVSDTGLQLQGIPVSGNRGASGIDGLLSTAVGFAAGSNKQVFFLLGDVSFLHDTNGLAVLSQRMKRKPMTIIVVNNHGGAIFSLLPVAGTTEPRILDQYFYTSHDVSVSNLCAAHGVKHLHASTKMELQDHLLRTQMEQTDCLIEVESSIATNADFHRILSKSISDVANRTMNALVNFGVPSTHGSLSVCKIEKMNYLSYRIQLSSPPTSSIKKDSAEFYREGFILSVCLEDGSLGYGEVAPLEIHKEDLLDVEEQLNFIVHKVQGAEISHLLTLLNGSFDDWFWRCLGVPPSSIFPSVRCGIEMAVLNALALRHGSSLADMLTGQQGLLPENNTISKTENTSETVSKWIRTCALVDCDGTPSEVAQVVSSLVKEGFTSVKLKVARRKDPIEDSNVIREIRRVVGNKIGIRVDANRKWTLEQAVQFGSSVKEFDLEYIEEPVQHEHDIIKFCEETGVPTALDETIHDIKGDIFEKLKDFVHPNIVAVVIKPSVLGGFEKASLIAKWAQQHEKIAVISAAFESNLSLLTYIHFAYYIEQQNAKICKIRGKANYSATSHGFGTYKWLKEDVSKKPINICERSSNGAMEASIVEADSYLRNFEIDHKVIKRVYEEEHVLSRKVILDTKEISCSIKLQELEQSSDHNTTVVFLHGLFGTSEEWIPTMKSLSSVARCISIDLPGHGESQIHRNLKPKQKREISVELIADVLHDLISKIATGRVVLVGYSLGARIALYMALKYKSKIAGAVVISGSPGIKDEVARRIRAVEDESRARRLLTDGLQSFLENWYTKQLWQSLRSHPHFKDILISRQKHHDIEALANSVSGLSVGKQRSLWEDLKNCETPLLVVAGEEDDKFKRIAAEMVTEINRLNGTNGHANGIPPAAEIFVAPRCGHVAHLENPLPVINAVRKFISKLNT